MMQVLGPDWADVVTEAMVDGLDDRFLHLLCEGTAL
jgi:hypothetical protein